MTTIDEIRAAYEKGDSNVMRIGWLASRLLDERIQE